MLNFTNFCRADTRYTNGKALEPVRVLTVEVHLN